MIVAARCPQQKEHLIVMLCASWLEQAPDFYKYLAFSTETFGISGPSLFFLMISLYFKKKDYLLKMD